MNQKTVVFVAVDSFNLKSVFDNHEVKDREAWHATVHGVTKSWTRLSDWTTDSSTYE